VLTFFLMFVIMAVATDTRAVGEAAAIAIGGTVGLERCSAACSGASMNPALARPRARLRRPHALWLYTRRPRRRRPRALCLPVRARRATAGRRRPAWLARMRKLYDQRVVPRLPDQPLRSEAPAVERVRPIRDEPEARRRPRRGTRQSGCCAITREVSVVEGEFVPSPRSMAARLVRACCRVPDLARVPASRSPIRRRFAVRSARLAMLDGGFGVHPYKWSGAHWRLSRWSSSRRPAGREPSPQRTRCSPG
jgi:hypothetical protein